MATWDHLEQELDAWRRTGRTATLWWRDDDAVEPTPALERLLALSANHHIPLALAVIPRGMTAALCRLLENNPGCTVLQHGFSHANHAPAGEKKAELGAHREVDTMLAELADGLRLMQSKTSVFPALVPPWNRIAPALTAGLPAIGFEAVSTYGPRAARDAAPGLRQVNTHVDPVAWRTGGGFVGEALALDQVTAHLSARREGRTDTDEPTGLLTHHLVCDEPGWMFADALFAATRNHKAAKWLSAEETFDQ